MQRIEREIKRRVSCTLKQHEEAKKYKLQLKEKRNLPYT
jgi:hypothetical protein